MGGDPGSNQSQLANVSTVFSFGAGFAALKEKLALPAPPLEQIDIDELSPRSGAWVSQMRYLEQAGLGSAPNSAREAVARGARQVAFEMQMEARREAATVQQAAGMPSMGLGPTRPIRYDLPSPAPLPAPAQILRFRQSSDIASSPRMPNIERVPPPGCGQTGPKAVASRSPRHGATGSGGRHRRFPTGAAA